MALEMSRRVLVRVPSRSKSTAFGVAEARENVSCTEGSSFETVFMAARDRLSLAPLLCFLRREVDFLLL